MEGEARTGWSPPCLNRRWRCTPPPAPFSAPLARPLLWRRTLPPTAREFRFDTQVQHIHRQGAHFVVETGCGPMESRAVVNAAGVWGDVLHNQLCAPILCTSPAGANTACWIGKRRRSGEPYRLSAARCHGQGVLVTPHCPRKPPPRPHCHGISRTGDDTAYHPDGAGLRHRYGGPQRAEPAHVDVITSFAGLRAHLRAAAMTSTSWRAVRTSSRPSASSPRVCPPPRHRRVCGGTGGRKAGPCGKPDFIAQRRDIVHVRELPLPERQALVERDPAYGNILCRCEQISEGEIRDAIRRSPGARSLTASSAGSGPVGPVPGRLLRPLCHGVAVRGTGSSPGAADQIRAAGAFC